MNKIRITLLVTGILVVGFFGIITSFYARGYKFNFQSFKFEPNGILIVKSDPTGAQVFINTDLKGSSDANLSLAPGTYDVTIKKDGFIPWNKRLIIEKEVVIEIRVSLFKAVASLSPVTSLGSLDPVPSNDFTKLAYFVPPQEGQDNTKVGLWILETVNLPIGFTKEPRRLTDGNLLNATWQFSPDGEKLLLKSSQGIFLLDTGSYTPQNERVNIASKYQKTVTDWQKERKIKIDSKLKFLPEEISKILIENTKEIVFSPDETKILYIASTSANLKEGLVKPLPGSSTQKQERAIKEYQTYIYDIKEDRNFLIDSDSSNLTLGNLKPENSKRMIDWFPNSINLVLSEENQITIMDYDGTNRQSIYSGSYVAPFAFPFVSTSKLLILTNLGANSSIPNLYSLTLK